MATHWAYRKGHRDYFQTATVDEVLNEGDMVPGLPSFQVIETLGHSQDHLSFYCEDEQLFICGDHIIKGIHGGMFLDAPKPGNERAKPLLQYLSNLEKCRKLPAKYTFSGHGAIIDNFIRNKQLLYDSLRCLLCQGICDAIDVKNEGILFNHRRNKLFV